MCGARTPAPAAGETIKGGFERWEIGASRIERTSAPGDGFVVLLLFGIGKDFQQSLVARRPAAVFGWATANGFEQEKGQLALDRGRDLFELDSSSTVGNTNILFHIDISR